MSGLNTLIIVIILCIVAFLILDLIHRDLIHRKGKKIQEERDEIIASFERAHRASMRRLQEKKDREIRSLYPIGCLIPPRKDSDDTGPR